LPCLIRAINLDVFLPFLNCIFVRFIRIYKISTCISDAIKKYGDARFLLSGGSTPMNLYSLLSEETIEWEKVKIGLVDERFVPKENLFNNETQIKNNLLKNSAKFATIFGMVYNYENEMLNLKMVNQQYKTFFERIDFTSSEILIVSVGILFIFYVNFVYFETFVNSLKNICSSITC
jgi:hypothetical protein